MAEFLQYLNYTLLLDLVFISKVSKVKNMFYEIAMI